MSGSYAKEYKENLLRDELRLCEAIRLIRATGPVYDGKDEGLDSVLRPLLDRLSRVRKRLMELGVKASQFALVEVMQEKEEETCTSELLAIADRLSEAARRVFCGSSGIRIGRELDAIEQSLRRAAKQPSRVWAVWGKNSLALYANKKLAEQARRPRRKFTTLVELPIHYDRNKKPETPLGETKKGQSPLQPGESSIADELEARAEVWESSWRLYEDYSKSSPTPGHVNELRRLAEKVRLHNVQFFADKKTLAAVAQWLQTKGDAWIDHKADSPPFGPSAILCQAKKIQNVLQNTNELERKEKQLDQACGEAAFWQTKAKKYLAACKKLHQNWRVIKELWSNDLAALEKALKREASQQHLETDDWSCDGCGVPKVLGLTPSTCAATEKLLGSKVCSKQSILKNRQKHLEEAAAPLTPCKHCGKLPYIGTNTYKKEVKACCYTPGCENHNVWYTPAQWIENQTRT